MFTGIIEETGKVEAVAKGSNSAVITIAAVKVLEDTKIGDSIAGKWCVSDCYFNKWQKIQCGCDGGDIETKFLRFIETREHG